MADTARYIGIYGGTKPPLMLCSAKKKLLFCGDGHAFLPAFWNAGGIFCADGISITDTVFCAFVNKATFLRCAETFPRAAGNFAKNDVFFCAGGLFPCYANAVFCVLGFLKNGSGAFFNRNLFGFQNLFAVKASLCFDPAKEAVAFLSIFQPLTLSWRQIVSNERALPWANFCAAEFFSHLSLKELILR